MDKSNIVAVVKILGFGVVEHLEFLVKECEVVLFFMISSCDGIRPLGEILLESLENLVTLSSIFLPEFVSVVTQKYEVRNIPGRILL